MDSKRTAELLQDHDFPPLFVEELGWDALELRFRVYLTPKGKGKRDAKTQASEEIVGDEFLTFTLTGVAHKRGMAILQCACDEGEPFPDVELRRRITLQVSKRIIEHCLVFTDSANESQTWQWTARERKGAAKHREHTLQAEYDAAPLTALLSKIAFTPQEEAGVTLVHVTRRIRAAFDVAPLKSGPDDGFTLAARQDTDFCQWVSKLAEGIGRTQKSRAGRRYYLARWDCEECAREFFTSAYETSMTQDYYKDDTIPMLFCPWCGWEAYRSHSGASLNAYPQIGQCQTCSRYVFTVRQELNWDKFTKFIYRVGYQYDDEEVNTEADNDAEPEKDNFDPDKDYLAYRFGEQEASCPWCRTQTVEDQLAMPAISHQFSIICEPLGQTVGSKDKPAGANNGSKANTTKTTAAK